LKRSTKVFLALLFCPLFLSSLAPNVGAAATTQAVDPIASIRQQYAAINRRASRYRKVKKELSGFSVEGGTLVAYFDGPAIVKLVATYYGESGQAVEEYYYANAKLIFVYRKDSRYNRPLSGKVVHSYEDRFYFANDRLIQWLNDQGKPAPNGIADYQQKQGEYLESSRKFVDGARASGPTIEAQD
jgi:hypothetical protein